MGHHEFVIQVCHLNSWNVKTTLLILSIDTSGRNGSLALARGEGHSFELLELVPLEGGQYSAALIPALAGALECHRLTKDDIEAFCVASGPGSFTGLRVGLATVKGLAEIVQRPIAAVSVLEALASSADHPGRVITALDAGRREVYSGEYEVQRDAHQATCIGESLLKYDEFHKLVDANPAAQLITADQQIPDLVPAHIRAKVVERPQADLIARIGLCKIQRGETTPGEALEANYIRRSDAEIFAKPDA